MARVKIKNIANVRDIVKREFDKIRRDPQLLREIGKVTSEFLVKTSQTGKNPKTGEKYPRLSKSWVDQRDYLKRFNSIGGFFLDSRKSNVTFTGKLLSAVKKFTVEEGNAVVIFEPDGDHPGYKTASSRTKSVSFKKLLTYLADQGRVVLGINKTLEKRINILVRSFMRKKIIKSKF